ncbi:MAG: polysaccharide deacetylase family protein [Nitrospira sp.]|nr:polysaccharide deacetylase family protein [Nitrospira sp.]
MSLGRALYYKIISAPRVATLFSPAQRDCATIFMLHRFQDPNRGIAGFDPAQLQRGLEYLRNHRYEIVSLENIFDRLAKKESVLRGAIAFTIDDGYVDQAEIAGRVFAEYDCPVTTFVTTGFIDGHLWFWWDKIDYIFSVTSRKSIKMTFPQLSLSYELESYDKRLKAQEDFTQRCKVIADDVKHRMILCLAEAAGVELPEKPPQRYAPMSWDQARICEERGMTFGPHTVTHPILSRTDSHQSKLEIEESWLRLNKEVRHPVNIFCYPNGQWEDFSQREIEVLQKLGLQGAVVGEPGFADPLPFGNDPAGRFKVMRFGFPETLPRLVQYVSGVERCKMMVRRSIR